MKVVSRWSDARTEGGEKMNGQGRWGADDFRSVKAKRRVGKTLLEQNGPLRGKKMMEAKGIKARR